MASSKPRITVTLTPRQHEVLKSISESGGSSMSALLGELIEVTMPTLERMAHTFKKLRQAQTIERAKMVEAMDESLAILEPIAASAIDQFDLFLGKIEQGIDAPGPQRSEDTDAATTAPAAPITNRGATTPRAKPRNPVAPRVSRVSEKSAFSKKSGS